MPTKSCVVVFLIAFFAVGNAWSADVNVSPGVDTLSAAITAASEGDTLILENGTYSGPVLVDKSLTIRANTNDADAMITGTFQIAGAGISVVVQGLKFSTNINLDQAADVKILQNTLLSGAYIDVTDYKTSEGDGKLAVIGNHLTQNGTIKVINSDDAYIAGNTLDSGQIQARVPVWIVGNEVVGLGGSSPVPPVEVLPGTGAVQVIGNRVTMNGYNAHEGIDVNASDALIAGNIIEVNHVAGGSNYQPVYGIRSSSTTYATVVNNIVYQGSIGTPVHATNNAGIEASGRILGNIVFNLTHDLSAIKGLGSVEIKNNLCFNNSTNCGTANGNIEAHPEFEPDLQLAPTSPAIDAGPENFAFADLDRTRNDIGAYGGPWSIGQYDAQRDPLNYAPYVFPLFKAQASFSDGSLEVRALGVARLR